MGHTVHPCVPVGLLLVALGCGTSEQSQITRADAGATDGSPADDAEDAEVAAEAGRDAARDGTVDPDRPEESAAPDTAPPDAPPGRACRPFERGNVSWEPIVGFDRGLFSEAEWSGTDPEGRDCPSGRCADAQGPFAGTPIIFLNDEQVAVLGVVCPGDTVTVYIPIRDSECQLGCRDGIHEYEVPGGTGAGGESVDGRLPCAPDGTQIYFTSSFIEVESGPHRAAGRISNACGEPVEGIDVAFDVQ